MGKSETDVKMVRVRLIKGLYKEASCVKPPGRKKPPEISLWNYLFLIKL